MKEKTIRMLLVALVPILLNSCIALVGVGAGAGVGTYAYIEGNLKRNYEAPLSQVWEATTSSVQQMGLKTEEQKKELDPLKYLP